MKNHEKPKQTLAEWGFNLDRKINVTLALGATAVAIASPLIAPGLAAPAAIVAAGSIANIPVNDRISKFFVNPKKESPKSPI